ncbi:MAG: glutathione-disulfide reductase [Phaeovulum sp.]|uniref:glutathione-disulfide reductase n=1 Tax=Phaeovulum sp. TaxID=2934796 RepID=UPI00272F081E|nr:glutathione-disulfide reductase [Phaeovulum sp.]MDP2062349.1 glutathione-disulfide reductase [Phaeovulum sp.]
MSGCDVDLFVIGGGSGGVRAARIAAGEHGARVALAEEYRMGGTCVIRGCVPKKLMVFASGFPAAMAEARAYGWQVTTGGFDWTAFRLKLDAELDRLEAAYRAGLKGAGVAVYNTRAVIEEPQLVRLATGERLRARHILVATGGRPFVPEFPGAEHVITSNEIFKLEALPGSVLVVGGGFIACEFASILNGLGVKVTQYYRGTQVLRGFDDEARAHIGGQLVEAGVDLRLGADVAAIERRPGGFCVRGIDGGEAVFDAVVYATGRVPNTAGLGLEAAGVKLGRRGEILVDGWSQSSVPWLHAVGDVTDRINLTPVAIREGHAYADTVFGGTPRQPDHELVASAVFTQPCELGTVGLTEEEARAAGPVEIYATSFRPMRGAFAGRSHRVLMKLVVSAETRKVLGCHIVAPEAGEMIQMAAIAIKMGASKEDFDRTCAVHPSMAEELVTMRKPARAG